MTQDNPMTDTPEAVALKPCPYCGGAAKRIEPMGEWTPNGPPHYGPNGVRYVCGALYETPIRDCPGRSIFYGDDTEAKAVAAWNTRPDAGLVRQLVGAAQRYEEMAILHGQQVIVTFKDTKDGAAFFTALRDLIAARAAGYGGDTPTGNPYIDLDVGSITVPIGYVRKMVEALERIDALAKRSVLPGDLAREALKLGQSVITAFDQEAGRG